MKKITSLLILFLLFVGLGVQAQRIAGLKSVPTEKTLPANLTTGYYLLKQVNDRSGCAGGKGVGFIRANEEKVDSWVSSKGSEAAPKSSNYIWYVEVVDKDKHHIKISTANKLMSWQKPTQFQKNLVSYTDEKAALLEIVTLETDPSWEKEAPKEGSAFLRAADKSSYVHFSGDNLGSWDDTNMNSLYMVEFYPIEESQLERTNQIDVIYTYYLEGREGVIGENTTPQDIGSDYNAPRLNIGYLVNTYVNTEKISADNYRIKVVCKEELPFKKSTDFSTAHWYFMTITPSRYYLSHEGGDRIPLNRTSVSVVPEDKDQWCFIGNAVDGFKIYNKAAGDKKILSSTTAFDGSSDGKTFPIMTVESQIKDSANKRWFLGKGNIIGGVQGSYWGQQDFPSHRLNNRDGALAYWVSGANGGSTFLFSPVPSDVDVIANFKEANKNIVGFVGGYTAEQYNDLKTIDNIDALRDFIEKQPKVALQANGYYRLQNVQRSDYLSTAFEDQTKGKLVKGDFSDANIDLLWQLEPKGNKYLLKHVNTGMFSGAPTDPTMKDPANSEQSNQIAEYDLVPRGDAQFSLKSGDFLVEYGSNVQYAIGSWSSASKGGDGSWYIQPVEDIHLDMNQVGTSTEYWSSLYLPFSVSIPAGVEAYWGTCSTDIKGNGVLNLKPLKNSIPARTGVLLKGDLSKYHLTISEDKSSVEGNCLKGTTVELPLFYSFDGHEQSMRNSYYTLGYMSATGVGFYHPLGKYLKANRAYIPVAVNPILVKGYRLVFDDEDEMTGVDQVEIENGQAADVYYDLSGRRVLDPKKGVYIKNGKKVYVK